MYESWPSVAETAFEHKCLEEAERRVGKEFYPAVARCAAFGLAVGVGVEFGYALGHAFVGKVHESQVGAACWNGNHRPEVVRA